MYHKRNQQNKCKWLIKYKLKLQFVNKIILSNIITAFIKHYSSTQNAFNKLEQTFLMWNRYDSILDSLLKQLKLDLTMSLDWEKPFHLRKILDVPHELILYRRCSFSRL